MSLLSRRRVLISATNKETPLLPKNYQQVEFIQSTGTQYIDTGFYPNQDTKVEIKVMGTVLRSGAMFGVRSISKTNRFILNYYFEATTKESLIQFQYGNIVPSATFSDITNIHTYSMDKSGVYIDDISYIENVETETFSSTLPLYVFGNNDGGVVQYNIFNGKMYFCKIYDNGVLARDFIPCYRKADNKAGMYDLVSGNFYTNKGTGEFILGGEV